MYSLYYLQNYAVNALFSLCQKICLILHETKLIVTLVTKFRLYD